MTPGHKKAPELIAENKRTRSPFLDLGNLGLTDGPEEVFECVWLENLNLGEYSVHVQYPLKRVKRGDVYITAYVSLGRKEGLVIKKDISNLRDNISINKISSVSTRFSELKKLETLSLSNNQLAENLFDFSSTTLQTLILDRNIITNPAFIENFPNLQYIDLSNNKITELRPFKNLKSLMRLDLKENRIQNLKSISALKSMKHLDLTSNFIREITLEAIYDYEIFNGKVKSPRLFSSDKIIRVAQT